MLTIPNKIAEIAMHFARHDVHGYSQPNRGTHDHGTEVITLSDGTQVRITASDVDCSELVRQCVDGALGHVAIPYMWTGNEDAELRRVGFTRRDFLGQLLVGDILWREGHTAIYIGNTGIVEAAYDENGGITGPQAGDQTGDEVRIAKLGTNWKRIYRWEDALTEDDFKRIQSMIDKAVADMPRKVWSYKNTKLEKVDAYQILRDIRDIACALIGPLK